MDGPQERKALAVELFTVTGEAVPENDPTLPVLFSSLISWGNLGAWRKKPSLRLRRLQ